MASPSYTYTLANSTTADASQVMQNFNDILNGITDGTKDLSISALTCAGTATLNGHVNLGNSSADDLTITASLASTLAIKTNNTYDIGSATLGLRKLYLGNGGAGATCDIVSASHATTREYTVPDCSAAASFVMTQATQTISGTKTFDGQLIGKGTATNDSAAAGYIGENMTEFGVGGTTVNLADMTVANVSDTITLTAGHWEVWGNVAFDSAGAATIDLFSASISDTSATLDTTANRFAQMAAADGTVLADVGRSGTVVLIGPTTFKVATTQALRMTARVGVVAGTTRGKGYIFAARRR